MTPTVKYRAEDSPDVVFDYDKDGRIVGIELLNATAQLPDDLLDRAGSLGTHPQLFSPAARNTPRQPHECEADRIAFGCGQDHSAAA